MAVHWNDDAEFETIDAVDNIVQLKLCDDMEADGSAGGTEKMILYLHNPAELARKRISVAERYVTEVVATIFYYTLKSEDEKLRLIKHVWKACFTEYASKLETIIRNGLDEKASWT